MSAMKVLYDQQREAVFDEVMAIMAAWPAARITHTHLSATAIIEEPSSTYIVEVRPDSVRSLHIAYGEDGWGVTDGWRQGWVD